MTFADAKKLSIVHYLSSIGMSPTRIRGADHWYVSPFRSEREPSFKVNDKLNLWYDHGAGVGGTIIDLGMNLFGCTAKDFIQKLSLEGVHYLKQHEQKYGHVTQPKIEVVDVCPINDQRLRDYLAQRRIPISLAGKYCSEATFLISGKAHKAIGFPNDAGGFELRNHWFKGSSSPKHISLINNAAPNICVTEAFFDMLSIHNIHSLKGLRTSADFLVLNSLGLLKRSIPSLAKYNNVDLFLDNDEAGRKFKDLLSNEGVQFKDRSDLYKDFKDINDYLRYAPEVNLKFSKGRGIS